MSAFTFFLPLAKINEEKRTVSGYASTPTRDSDGEIISLEAVKAALPDYMQWRNIREMHALKAVGTASEARMDEKGLYLTAKIVDEAAWKKCKEGVYKGFSIGGTKLAKEGDVVTEIAMTEISVVDRPANPDCKIHLAKRAKDGGDGYLLQLKKKENNPPAAHDGFSLPALPGKEISPNDVRPQENATRKAEDASEPYGDVHYADPGHQEDKKKRYPIDTEEHIRAAWNYINKPKNAGKYSPENISKVKNAIIAAWKSKIDQGGPPSAKVKKTGKLKKAAKVLELLELDNSKLTLAKGMRAARNLTFAFDQIRDAQRDLCTEAQQEGGDKKDKALAVRLGSIAADLADLISEKASHEGKEAKTMSDADDQFLRQILGDKEMEMDGNDELGKALLGALRKAAKPTVGGCVKKASEDMKEARKARKAAAESMQEMHKMHKAAYLGKAAGKKKEDGEEFDHAGCMEKLQHAYGEIQKMGNFMKNAKEHLTKAEKLIGEHGQMPGDAEAGFYEVPEGVRGKSSREMATASPGGNESGSMPPEYPVDGGVYAGKSTGRGNLSKAANADMMTLMLEKAKLEGEVNALRQLPMASGGRRPFAFDINKASGGQGQSTSSTAALFAGVNPSDLNYSDPQTHEAATAKVIGNFLTSGHFGKSMMDPSFKGTAGGNRD